jgi:putative nucleotidyltransferase with HDIG domain
VSVVPAQATRLTQELERILLARLESDSLVLPAMPAVPARCHAVLCDPDFSAKRLVEQLEADPVLAALVMRYANSAAYGSAVKLLEPAVARRGAERMKSIVTEYAAHELFQSSDPRIVEANRRIWEHSVAVAILARDLAALSGSGDGDACFLGGLLHDVGKPVLAAMMLEVERKLARGQVGWIAPATWVAAIDGAHRRVGTALTTQWALPAEVTAVVRDCSDYDANNRTCAANVVRLANAIAKREGYTTGPIDRDDLGAMIMIGRSMIGIDEDVVKRLAGALEQRVGQAVR